MSDITQPGQKTLTSRPLNIWIVTDHKPGHLNQLKGLCERIAAHTNSAEQWISTNNSQTSWLDCLLRQYHYPLDHPALESHQPPDIVIGAGHSTHKEVLAIKRHFRCFSAILMKPSLPTTWFDATIIPEHDNPTPNSHTLITKGVLNTITPLTNSSAIDANKHRGLVLIGGESKHYHWDTNDIVRQVMTLSKTHRDIQWTLSNSRRTDPDLLPRLEQQLPKNIHIIPHTETPNGWVKEQMAKAGQVWVTPDSVSMVYEAITSGADVGLFNMTAKKNGRIVKGIQALVDKGVTHTFSANDNSQKMPKSTELMWESERSAIWLLAQYSAFKKTNTG